MEVYLCHRKSRLVLTSRADRVLNEGLNCFEEAGLGGRTKAPRPASAGLTGCSRSHGQEEVKAGDRPRTAVLS
jgi:hypothetical protein